MTKFLTLSALILSLLNPSGAVKNQGCDPRFFENTWDGYVFDMGTDYTADTQFAPDTVIFRSEATDIEIYAQECQTGSVQYNYTVYTSMAITENSHDFCVTDSFADVDGISVLSWNRQKLKKIQNDRNYYLKIDIPKNKTVFTMLVKSTQMTEDYKKYLSLISFCDKASIAPPAQRRHARMTNFGKETRDFYNMVFGAENSLTWGIFQPDYLTADTLREYEKETENRFDVLLWYTSLAKSYNPSRVRAVLDKAYSDGKITELTLQPSLNHEAGNDLFRLLDGYYDSFLNSYARDIKNFGHPVIFRFANEMNGDWCEYSGYCMGLDTSLYRQMYRYVFSIFQKNNANNVIWVWNPNGRSFPDFKWNSQRMYYPGDEFVDVLGLTLYNTGTFYDGETWTEFDNLYIPLYAQAMQEYDMPFMITEFACAREGGSKEKWTENMLSKIELFDRIKLAVWWNGADFASDGRVSRAYYIDDSDEMKNIFKNYFSLRNRP